MLVFGTTLHTVLRTGFLLWRLRMRSRRGSQGGYRISVNITDDKQRVDNSETHHDLIIGGQSTYSVTISM